jgi:hypothetical protein
MGHLDLKKFVGQESYILLARGFLDRLSAFGPIVGLVATFQRRNKSSNEEKTGVSTLRSCVL